MKVSCYPFLNATRERIEGRPLIQVFVNRVFWQQAYGNPITTDAVQVANWLRLNTTRGEVFHEPQGGTLLVPEDVTNQRQKANPVQRFYFSIPSEASAFRQAINEFDFHINMRPSLQSVDLDNGQSFALGGAILFLTDEPNSEQGIAFWCWCRDNLKESVFHERNLLIFSSADDLLLFKMTFTGKSAKTFNYDLINMPHEVTT